MFRKENYVGSYLRTFHVMPLPSEYLLALILFITGSIVMFLTNLELFTNNMRANMTFTDQFLILEPIKMNYIMLGYKYIIRRHSKLNVYPLTVYSVM